MENENPLTWSILEIAPLSKDLREKVKENRVGIDESYKLMVSLSDLIFEKSCWLLPLSGLGQEETACAGTEEDDYQEIETLDPSEEAQEPLITKEELTRAVRRLGGKLECAGRMRPRGFFNKPKGVFLMTETLDPKLLAEAMIFLSNRVPKETKVVVISKWNFVQRLRLFWGEIRRISAKALVMRFSWFLGKERKEAILNFLVFLELVKRGRLFAEQKDIAGEILFSTKKEALFAASTEDEANGDG